MHETCTHVVLSMYLTVTVLLCTATIEYEAELRHKNEMQRVAAEIQGR